jgi:hypothetical protein
MENIFNNNSRLIIDTLAGICGRLLYACLGIIFYYMYIHRQYLVAQDMISDMYWVIICGLGFALSAFLLHATDLIKRDMIKPFVVSSICWFCLYGWFAYWLAGQC